MKIRIRSAYLLASVCLFLISGCLMQNTSLSIYSETSGQENTTPVSSLTSPETTPPQTSQAATESTAPDLLGVIDIQDGDMLERDIIPQLATVFSLSQQAVMDSLASGLPSVLINPELKDFRKMEGIILPGRYDVYAGSDLNEYVALWIKAAELRYRSLTTGNEAINELLPYEKLALASMVEAECLANEHQAEAATVFLNRLAAKSKLQSCVTAEYALGYQRPYLTSDDLKIQSSYNTYVVAGLPVGPICSVDDESLRAAAGKKLSSDIYYFYYDYILNDMFFFADYQKFQEACAVSKKAFIAASEINLREKINKQDLYGQ